MPKKENAIHPVGKEAVESYRIVDIWSHRVAKIVPSSFHVCTAVVVGRDITVDSSFVADLSIHPSIFSPDSLSISDLASVRKLCKIYLPKTVRHQSYHRIIIIIISVLPSRHSHRPAPALSPSGSDSQERIRSHF